MLPPLSTLMNRVASVRRYRARRPAPRVGLLLVVPAVLWATACSGAGPAGNGPYVDYVRNSFYVEVRDGTRLAMNVYRPAVDGRAVEEPLPVVFAFTPYRARFYNADGSIEETGRSERLGLKQLTEAGYVVAVADIRGKGASFGHRRGFQDRTEAYDGYDLVEWLARQPWSSGKVGMTGCSYLGGSTMQVATTVPPSLRAVFIGATDFDKYEFVRKGGITAQFNTRPDEPPEYDLASVPVDEDNEGRLLAEAVTQHAANTPMAGLWYGMPYRDSESSYTGTRFWNEVGPYTYLNALKNSDVAFYFWGNWSDEPTDQVIKSAANIESRMLIGAGTHCRPLPETDLAGELRRFFDFHLKGIDNGLDDEPPYRWRLQNVDAGAGWIRSDSLPGRGIERQPWFLADAALLPGDEPAEGGETSFSVRYDLGESEYFSFWPDSPDANGIVFTGPPLEEDLALVGYPIADLEISVDRQDANVFAYVEDVGPDGLVTVVSFGRLAASHRAIAEPPFDYLGLPFHSGLEADVRAMVPGVPARLRFALLPNAWVFKSGHRIRLAIAGADLRQRNLADIAEDPPPKITVHHGGGDGSRIELPLVEPARLLGGIGK
ncbi:MAG: CocE/NonD family hydrolase [Gammaproteobacteria bacterium]|nr:CocE/NonD family hydrolase [Gammaproteobacteria bacterium]MDH4253548.1 CocE/NonD family hydrolase [Gammaproteobacteria bacterium]MDH5310112.1 CocE/NonD family hydrolase [Gammaproteobacteria bacterium]